MQSRSWSCSGDGEPGPSPEVGPLPPGLSSGAESGDGGWDTTLCTPDRPQGLDQNSNKQAFSPSLQTSSLLPQQRPPQASSIFSRVRGAGGTPQGAPHPKSPQKCREGLQTDGSPQPCEEEVLAGLTLHGQATWAEQGGQSHQPSRTHVTCVGPGILKSGDTVPTHRSPFSSPGTRALWHKGHPACPLPG